MNKQLDKTKIEALTPNYEFGCKRVVVSSDYYPVFNKPNVFVHREPIVSATGNTIGLQNGEKQDLDASTLHVLKIGPVATGHTIHELCPVIRRY